MIVALPAVAVAATVAVPKEVAPPESATVPPLLVIVALPAFDVAKKSVKPPAVAPAVPLTVAALLLIVTLPLIAVPEKTVGPAGVTVVSPLLVIVCVVPELFTIPVPWTVSTFPLVAILKAPATAPKLTPAVVMAVPSVTVPPVVPTKFATLPSVQVAPVCAVAVELHEKGGTVIRVFTQVPLPATVGFTALPVQNRSTLQTFGSTLKVIRAVMSAAKMPGSLFGGRVATLIFCVFMGSAAMDG